MGRREWAVRRGEREVWHPRGGQLSGVGELQWKQKTVGADVVPLGQLRRSPSAVVGRLCLPHTHVGVQGRDGAGGREKKGRADGMGHNKL